MENEGALWAHSLVKYLKSTEELSCLQDQITIGHEALESLALAQITKAKGLLQLFRMEEAAIVI